MSKTRRTIRIIDRSIDRALTVLFLILLMIGVYFMADSYWVYSSSGLASMPGYTPQTVEEMLEIAPDAIAWITIDDTEVSYPVMQGIDNTEYLNKNANGEYSLSGAIFLDSLNNRYFTDYYNVLYGHHMSGGYMFGAIDYYVKPEYFDKHRKGTLLVIDGKKYSMDIFAYVQTDASVGVVFDVTSGGDIMGFVAANASIYRNPSEGRVVALTTCKSPLTTERTCLFATIKERADSFTDEELQEEMKKNQPQGEVNINPNYEEAMDRLEKRSPGLIERLINWFKEHFN
ncbi:MAG: class B sortase [Mogibacterium sp.]|nr:class B sortase [Mogibacterium sp.]